ncbi:hypothetical protein [Haloarcula sp. Atlit-120R]|uniref:hypothetical protein n=1 Tax=Haloarcula sp. Atlit-120R TaxID=2282135 RepID=UPI000EF218D1|nr:hypothetical protein [Haloarcula sp. Atlit-120R]RLM32618.1 hypothetical protein DVK01_20305 [Haloarcula sp. Atlit-120R]
MKRTLALLLATLLVVQASVAPVAAQSDEGAIDGMFSAAEESTVLNTLEGIRDGVLGRISDGVAGATDDRTAGDMAADLQTEYNDNSAAYESWSNNRTTADTSLDVLELTISQDDESETLYLTSDVVDGSYTNTTMRNSTDRTVDESCEIEGNAARNAADELGEFREDYVADDGNVTTDYLASMGSRYGSNVDCSFSTEGL